MKNYYQILNLESTASKDEIKKAFRLYAQHYHPDKQNGNKFFEQRFIEIKNAYDILVDDNKRRAYDLSQKEFFNNNPINDAFVSEKTAELRKKETELKQREANLKKDELARIKKESELRIKEAVIKQKENHIRYEQEIANEKKAREKEQEDLWKIINTKKSEAPEINNNNDEKKKENNSAENNIGVFSYKIEGFYFSKKLGEGFAEKIANGIYLVIKISLTNVSKKTESSKSLIFKLIDNENCEFKTSSEGTFGLFMSGINTFEVFFKDCHPNIPIIGFVVFEVPEIAEYSIILSSAFQIKTIALLNIKKLIEINKEKERVTTNEPPVQHITPKETNSKLEKGATKFYCGGCKGEIFATYKDGNKVTCPHCKIVNSLPKLQEASSKYYLGAGIFNCGICKKVFYCNRKNNDKVLCPHCKSKNTLPSVKVKISTVIILSILVFLLIVVCAIIS